MLTVATSPNLTLTLTPTCHNMSSFVLSTSVIFCVSEIIVSTISKFKPISKVIYNEVTNVSINTYHFRAILILIYEEVKTIRINV